MSIDPNNPDYRNTPVSPSRPRYQYAAASAANPPVVSIITPFYNTGPVFHQTAESIKRQSLQTWEWLIVDDGSSDATALSILADYAQGDQRIRITTHRENLGLSAARNTGVRLARAHYIVLIDSDDLLEPTAIEKWFWFLQAHPEYAFVSGYSVGFGEQEYLWSKGFDDAKAFLNENQLTVTSMLRKAVVEAVGGFDTNMRAGFEDWDFWLRSAHHGYWGGMLPEYLDWYRRKPVPTERWESWQPARRKEIIAHFEACYPQLRTRGFPELKHRWHMPNEPVPEALPCANPLSKTKPRLLLIVPWMRLGGADKFNLDLVQQLTAYGWEVTLASTVNGHNDWMPHFFAHTPDIFVLPHFLRLPDFPRFLRYLIGSRKIDVVALANSELGYLLLPYLRAHFPTVTFVDYTHMEEEDWKSGGYPQMSVVNRSLLNLSIVSSEYLREWMLARGAESDQVEVCYTNVDTAAGKPDALFRAQARAKLDIAADITVILYAGRICSQKQPRVFAHTMLRLNQANADFMAVVAGNGEDLPWLESFVRQHHLQGRVRLLGAVPNQHMRSLYAAADLFFLPSQREGISLAIYEAMAAGLAIVGAKVGGQAELVTEECGYLVARSEEPAEEEAYTRVLLMLLHNPALIKKLGHAGRERVTQHFRLDQMGERMVALLEKANGLRQTAPRDRVGTGAGLVAAHLAIEYMRLYAFADDLWAQNHSGRAQPLAASAVVSLRAGLYRVLQRALSAPYQWAITRGWTGLPRLKQALQVALLGRSLPQR